MMKKIIFTMLSLTFLLSACRYEEGPFINFNKVEKRIRGAWLVSSVYKNGEITDTESPTVVEAKNSLYEFYKGSILIIKYYNNHISYESSGSYEFGNKKKTINLVFKNQYDYLSREYEIIKFTNKELKVNFTDDKSVKWTLVLALEYSFVPYDM